MMHMEALPIGKAYGTFQGVVRVAQTKPTPMYHAGVGAIHADNIVHTEYVKPLMTFSEAVRRAETMAQETFVDGFLLPHDPFDQEAKGTI